MASLASVSIPAQYLCFSFASITFFTNKSRDVNRPSEMESELLSGSWFGMTSVDGALLSTVMAGATVALSGTLASWLDAAWVACRGVACTTL